MVVAHRWPRLLATLIIAVCGHLPAAFAHDYWIARDASGFTLHQGHMYSRHAGEQSVPYDTGSVKEAHCADTSARFRTVATRGNPVRVDADCASLVFVIVSGYWSKTPWDTLNLPRNEVKGALQSWYSEETVTLVQPGNVAVRPAPLRGLQLTLTDDPSKLRTGDKFGVRAFVDGKPQANVAVAYDGETRGETDAEGRVNLRARHGGMQIVTASQESPLTDGKADKLVRGATLNFTLP